MQTTFWWCVKIKPVTSLNSFAFGLRGHNRQCTYTKRKNALFPKLLVRDIKRNYTFLNIANNHRICKFFIYVVDIKLRHLVLWVGWFVRVSMCSSNLGVRPCFFDYLWKQVWNSLQTIKHLQSRYPFWKLREIGTPDLIYFCGIQWNVEFDMSMNSMFMMFDIGWTM